MFWWCSGHLTILLCALLWPPVTCLPISPALSAQQMSPFKCCRAAGFCLLYLQTLIVNKPGKCIGASFSSKPCTISSHYTYRWPLTKLLNFLVLQAEAKMNSWYPENTYQAPSCSHNNELDGINQPFCRVHHNKTRWRRENLWLLVGDGLGSQECLASKVLPDKRAARIWPSAPQLVGPCPESPLGMATLQSMLLSLSELFI